MGDVLGVLHDYRASAVTCEHHDVESINVPNNRTINYWYFADANYINDTDENVVVFYLSNYYAIGSFETEADFIAATGATNWATDATKYYQFVGGSTKYTAYSSSDAFPSGVPLYANIANM